MMGILCSEQSCRRCKCCGVTEDHIHSPAVHLDIIRVFIYQLMYKTVALKILKFTLKQLRHVSV
jgi:hypothetical protein